MTSLSIQAARRVLEDRAAVVERSEGVVLIVADGAGGRSGGSRAAEEALRLLREAAEAASSVESEHYWAAVLAEVDQALEADPEAGETTAVVAAVTRSGIYGASAGDSAAWLVGRERRLDLTERQRRKPFLGTAAAIPVGFRSGPLQETLLLTTDGLFRYVDEARLRVLSLDADLEGAAGRLVQSAGGRSGEFWDDVAVILCRPALDSCNQAAQGGDQGNGSPEG